MVQKQINRPLFCQQVSIVRISQNSAKHCHGLARILYDGAILIMSRSKNVRGGGGEMAGVWVKGRAVCEKGVQVQNLDNCFGVCFFSNQLILTRREGSSIP